MYTRIVSTITTRKHQDIHH